MSSPPGYSTNNDDIENPTNKEQIAVEFARFQRRVRINLSITLLIAAVVTTLYWIYHEKVFTFPVLQTPSERLTYMARFLVFSSLPLLVSMVHVIVTRGQNPETGINPLLKADPVEKANRILANSMEQTMFHVLNMAAFSVLCTEGSVFLIPYLAFLFFTGRIIYWAGYTVNPRHRSPGFLLTVGPTLAVAVYNVLRVFGAF